MDGVDAVAPPRPARLVMGHGQRTRAEREGQRLILYMANAMHAVSGKTRTVVRKVSSIGACIASGLIGFGLGSSCKQWTRKRSSRTGDAFVQYEYDLPLVLCAPLEI